MSSPQVTKLMPEFERIRVRDEQILWIAWPRFLPYFASKTGSGWASLLSGLGLWVVLQHLELGKPLGSFTEMFWLFIIFAVVQGIYRIASGLLSYSKAAYAFTNSRILMRFGFSGVDFKTVDYPKILEMEVKVNALDRLCQAGTIRFYTGLTKTDEDSTTKIYINWPGLENAFGVFQQLQQTAANAQNPQPQSLA